MQTVTLILTIIIFINGFIDMKRHLSENAKTVKFSIGEHGYTPTKAHKEDAGFDIRSPLSCVLPARGAVTIDTKVHIAIPDGCCGLLVSKSGLNVKYGITSTGLIDSGYTGSIAVKLYNSSNEEYYIRRGDKITQLVILPHVNVKLKKTDKLTVEKGKRGENGFGSSGK